MAAKKLTTKAAIEQVLAGKRKPMKVRAIIDAAVPLTALAGKTPGQVIYSVLYSENKKDDGLVTQTGKGEFKLNPNRKAAGAKAPAAAPAVEQDGADAEAERQVAAGSESAGSEEPTPAPVTPKVKPGKAGKRQRRRARTAPEVKTAIAEAIADAPVAS